MLLKAEGDIGVANETESGSQAVSLALTGKPDVVLMDIHLVDIDGIEATRRIHAEAPQIPILMLSANMDLRAVRASLDAGASGYLLKRATGKELRAAVRAVAAGQPYFSAEVLAAARLPSGGRGSLLSPGEQLTAREIEVLQLIALGNTNREIAEKLGISVKTVDTHRTHLMDKLDIHEVAGLVRYAIRKGLIEL
jgi:two-component system, NarL family, response regulator NreC